MRDDIVTAEIYVQDYIRTRALTCDHIRHTRKATYEIEGVRFVFNAKSFTIAELGKEGHQDYHVPRWDRVILHTERDSLASMMGSLNRALCVAHYQDHVRKMYKLPEWFIITSWIGSDYNKQVSAVEGNCAEEMNVSIHMEIERPDETPLYTFITSNRYVLDDWDFQKSDKVRMNHFKFQEDRKETPVGSIFGEEEMVNLYGNLLKCGRLMLVPAVQKYTLSSEYPLPTDSDGAYSVKVLIENKGKAVAAEE